MKKQPRNLLEMPPTNATAITAIRDADRFLWDQYHDAREKNPEIEDTADWLIWWGDGFNDAVMTFHKAATELYEEYKQQKTASQPAAK